MKNGITNELKCFFFSLVLLTLSFIVPEDCRSAGDFEVTVDVSRTEGVAPLSVFFDATQTPELAGGSFVDSTFAWNFDEGNIDPNAKYKTASGFVAAHVFENPGTYRVSLSVSDPMGRQATEEVTITVLPFTGQTYYVAEDGSDDNDGLSMSEPVQTVGHALLELANQPNTRILFKNGDTFNTRCVDATGRPGPVIISNYQDPDSPSDQAPTIYNTAVNTDYATIVLGNDWRIMNLRIRSGGSSAGREQGPRYPGGVTFDYDTNNSLIYRLEQDNLANQWMDPYGQYNTVAECNIHDVSGTGFSHDGDGGALIGNWVHDKGDQLPEHIFRLQGGTRYFIAFNTFEANVVNFDSLTIRGDSEKVVIYKNILDRVTSINPQNTNSYEEYQKYVILDSNLFIGRDNPPNYSTATPIRQLAITVAAKDIVIRNNIIYNYEFGIIIADDTVVGPSQRIKVYNNTSINMTPGSSFFFINADPACLDIVVKNNLIFDNAGSDIYQTRIIRDRSETNTFNGISDNNLFFGSSWNNDMVLFNSYNFTQWKAQTGNDQESIFQAPNLATLDMESDNFALPLENSPPVNAGQFTGATLDYYGNSRDQSRDIGAVVSYSNSITVLCPEAPGNVTGTTAQAEVTLSWEASSGTEIIQYNIYRGTTSANMEIIANVDSNQLSYTDTDIDCGTTYTYAVSAENSAGESRKTFTDPLTTENCLPDPEDVNHDGSIDVLDVMVCVNVILGTETDPDMINAADVNHDGSASVLDVMIIINKILE